MRLDMVLRSKNLLILALLAGGLSHSEAYGQRAYQKYWLERLEELEPDAIIEDSNQPLDPANERRLAPENFAHPFGSYSVFPGEMEQEEDPVSKLALTSYVAGAYASESGSPTEALKFFSEAMKKDPENPWLKLRVARAALQVNDLSQSEVILEDLIKKDEKDFRAIYLMGEIDTMRRRYDDAKQWYAKVLEVKPKNIGALERLAQISYEIDRDLEKTKEYAQTILTVDDRNVNALLWNAEAAAFTGDVEHAADLYERSIRYSPAIINRMSEVARQLILRGQQENALVLYERALAISPTNDALRIEWEKAVRELGGEDKVREGYERLAGETKDERVADLYADYLRSKEEWDALKTLREEMLQRNPDHVPAMMDLARYHLRKEDLQAAEPYFEMARDSNPADPDIYRAIGMAKLEYGKVDEARTNLERALALNENDAEAMDGLALLEEHEGNYKRAEELLRKALEKKPVDAYLLKRLGTLHIATGERQKAKELFQQVLVANQFDFDAWLTLAQLYLEDGNAAQLDVMEDQSKDLFRPFPEVRVKYGALALSYGEFDRARRALEKALEDTPEDLSARYALARTYLFLDQPEMALRSVKDAESFVSESDPRHERLQRLVASVYEEMGQYAEAHKIWANLSQKNPNDLDLRGSLLLSLVNQKQNDQATEELNKVIREFKITEPVKTELLRAQTYQEMGDPSRAFSVLQQLLREHPDDHDAWLQYAVAAGQAGQKKIAQDYYQRLIDLGPPSENTYFITASNNLGYLYAQNGENLDEAERLIKQAYEFDPTAAYILDSLGWLYYQKGDLDSARKYLERAARLSLRDSEVFLHLGEVYEKLGEKELARAMYEKALKTDPDSKEAQSRKNSLQNGA